MITLKQWLYRNAKVPILCTLLAIILVAMVHLVMWQSDIHKRQLESTKRLVDMGTLAIIQSNRTLLESVLQHAFYELQAEKVVFCKDNQVQISYPTRASSCSEIRGKLFTKLLRQQAVGMPAYQFYFVVPLFSNLEVLSLLGVLMAIIILGIALILIRLNRKLNEDLIIPLASQIQSNVQLQIVELETIRKNNVYLSELKMRETLLKQNASLAHDLRDPVSALDKLISAMPHIPIEIRSLIKESIRRIHGIANSLLDHSKVSGLNSTFPNENEESFSVENISSLLSAIVEEKKAQFDDKTEIKITYTPEATAKKLFVKVQPSGFKRAVSNLINNAVQAIERSGNISIRLKSEGESCLLQIKDEGKGIPEEVLPMLGTEGFSYGKVGGSGLGLFGARRLIEISRGTLFIHSIFGSGTTVSVRLPRVKKYSVIS